MPTTLLQETLTRSAISVELSSRGSSPPSSPPGSPRQRANYNPHNLPDFSILSLNPELDREKLMKSPKLIRMKSSLGIGSDEDEDEVIEVSTPMMSIAATPLTSSRSSSPTRSATSRRALRNQLEIISKQSLDPLKRFPEEIKSRIFLSLSTSDLKTCRRICKRWRRSAILNYAWFRQFQLISFVTPGGGDEDLILSGSGVGFVPTWTRRESKEDWFFRYRNVRRTDGFNGPVNAIEAFWEKKREEGWMSRREERERGWEEQSEGVGSERSSKADMRDHYKKLTNTKTKDKKGRKAGTAKDRSGYSETTWD